MAGPEKTCWSKPELVVLVRSKPEEAVLAACKTIFADPGGQNNELGMCEQSCGANCDSLVGS